MSERELDARARLDEAQSLLRQAEREMMPRQIIEFLRGKAMEIAREVERETITGVPVPGELIAPGVREATQVESADIDRYIAARRRGFGQRTAPAPSGADRIELEKKFEASRKVPPGITFGQIAQQQRDDARRRLDRAVTAAIVGGSATIGREASEPEPPKKAQQRVAKVTGKRRIELED